ncbi:MAG TPA: hypothetical protein VGT44_09285, partial [Ktedonobacteraceae bacterium]|nr:hypothetical protein [Ktedonobacteraceae bacterium]
AEQAYLNSGVLIMRITAPSLCWMRAQLVTEQAEREALEASAYNLVYELLSGTVLEEKPLDRVIGMTTLMLLPARWKIEKGNFEGALENIAISRSLSFALSKVIQDEMGGTVEELDKEIGDPDTPPEKQKQLKGLRDFYLPLVRTGDYWTFTCDLLTYTINAKLAESQSKFQEAYRLYDEAARLEEDMRKIILVWMSLYANISTLDGIVGLDAPQHSIRSTYFQGMASLSRGDSELMKGDYAEARKHYQNANTTFDTAARSWTLQMERLNSPSQIDGRANADRERRLCLDRMRYCDAKDEMAQAQRYSAYDEFADASEHFDNAAIILNALWKDSLDRETPRNLDLFKASEMFCKGCALLEEARRVSREDIMLKAKEPIDRAVSLFEDASEPLWSKYINALRLEYEADIYKKLSNASASQKNQLQAAVYAQFAQKQASEASDIFKQLGVEKRVSGMDRLAHSMAHSVVESQALSLFSPPNPADAPMASSNNAVQSMKDQLRFGGIQPGQIISENRLETFLAEMSAIDSNLDDLKQQFGDGDLDQARYLKMEAKRIQQRSAILQKVRKELEGRDKDLDTVMQDATTGGQEERVLMDRLAEVAQRRGLTSSLIDSLTRHQGTFLPSLIEVGKQLIKLSD